MKESFLSECNLETNVAPEQTCTTFIFFSPFCVSSGRSQSAGTLFISSSFFSENVSDLACYSTECFVIKNESYEPTPLPFCTGNRKQDQLLKKSSTRCTGAEVDAGKRAIRGSAGAGQPAFAPLLAAIPHPGWQAAVHAPSGPVSHLHCLC